MTDKKLRWGLLSTARINRAVIPPIRASARSELVAVASRAREQGEAYAREWGVPRVQVGYEALLADPEIDAIYISLPNSLHAEWAIKCAEAGKHVLCEKPLAITMDEVERMIAAARKNRTVLAEAFMYRHHPQTLKVRELIQQGLIGQVSSVHGTFAFNIGSEDDVRLNPDLGGGSLWDVGCYPVSYTRSALGEEPVEVFGWQRPHGAGRRRHIRRGDALRLRRAGDVRLRLPFASALANGNRRRGGNDHADQSLQAGSERHHPAEARRSDRRDPGHATGVVFGEIEDMADAVLEGQAPRISLEDSRANVKALLALYQAAKERKPVRLDM